MDDSGPLRVRVLGPLRVTDVHGRDLTPPGDLQRRLLALLVLRRGHLVPTDEAVETLWPGRLPEQPDAALQNHVSRLRRALPHGAIESTGDGYRLRADTVDVDADRLHTLLAGHGQGQLADLDSVLASWHGPAYPELDEVDHARSEIHRLHELQVRAKEVVAERRLSDGITDGIVAELGALVETEPLRERPRSLLMTALVAEGRRADALRVFDDFRRRVGEELGIDPSPALSAQHDALLRGETVTRDLVATRPLPTPVTSLVGRSELTNELAGLVATNRLVTLVGPGGIGKTRLLLETGHLLQGRDRDRPVVWCELSPADPESAERAVATALDVDPRPGVPASDQIAAVIGTSALVLLLDNCEHVIEPMAAMVELLLARCPHLRVVTSSRERLRLAGEHVRWVPALDATDAHAPGVRLFLDRASAARSDFDPSVSDLDLVVQVVRRLDGLPLAIELAAARLFTHELDEVAAGLDQRFALLTGGSRTSQRHGSLAAAVSWSYDGLDEQLQHVFLAASVFVGPFTATDLAAVAAIDPDVALVALVELTERSLVTRAAGRRFQLLETLRSFGVEQLARAGDVSEYRCRHARYMVGWAEDADRRLIEPEQRAIAELDAAVPELHAALGWLVEQGDAALAARLVVSLLDYCFLRLRPDVLAWAERVTSLDPEDEGPLAANVWVVASYAAWMAGDVQEAGLRAAHARRVAAREGALPPEVCDVLGNGALYEGDLDQALQWYRRAAEAAADDPAHRALCGASEVLALGYADHPDADRRAREVLAEIGDAMTPYAAFAWYAAGEASLGRDDEHARACFDRALVVADQTRAAFVTGLAGASRASLDARLGDPVEAAEDFKRLVGHWRRAGMWSTQWTMLRSIAQLLDRLDRPLDAAVLLGALRSTDQGHRIYGADEVALGQLEARLRASLGDEGFDAALGRGAVLDGDAAVEHALRSL